MVFNTFTISVELVTIGGQHWWASAPLAVCHIHRYYCIALPYILAINNVCVCVYSENTPCVMDGRLYLCHKTSLVFRSFCKGAQLCCLAIEVQECKRFAQRCYVVVLWTHCFAPPGHLSEIIFTTYYSYRSSNVSDIPEPAPFSPIMSTAS